MLIRILALVWVHFVADFILQTDRMALGKSSSNRRLLEHVLVYGACLLPFGFRFALVSTALHFCTDFVTSRATSALWKREKRHWFFVVIGLDQALHMTALLLVNDWLQ